MFAPKIAKPQTKEPASSTNSPTRNRWTLARTQSIGNQASLRFLEHHASRLTPSGSGVHQEPSDELDPHATRDLSWDFSKISVFPRDRSIESGTPLPLSARLMPASIQPKLIIGDVKDPLEHEADRVADQVLRIPDREAAVDPATMRISRKCAGCEEEKRQRKESESKAHTGDAPALVHSVLRSPGQPLDAVARAYFEPRFRYDFSQVRIHTDELAGRSAEAVAAEAYTVGSHVVFGPGRYRPESSGGRRLLAHELTHVVQQSNREIVARQPSKAPTRSKTVFHPGVMHNHQPSGRWGDVQNNPNSATGIESICKHFDPRNVVRLARLGALGIYGNPIAKDHLDWYLAGSGADFIEDDNLELMLRTDSGVQDKIAKSIPSGTSTGIFSGHVEITQDDYSSVDFQFSFGAIDRLDFEVDFAAGTIHAWFQDRYEWHPFYPSLYKTMSGDAPRPTNCVHAALVELKSEGAKDYWMKGEMPFKVIPLASSTAVPTPPSVAL